MEPVVIYSAGIVHLSACADSALSREEVTEAVNKLNLCGTTHGWVISEEPTFRQGGPNPGPCEKEAGRTHYLFSC